MECDKRTGSFKIPDWATSAPPGAHLDVCKSDQLLQKLLVDEKSHYYFGRNREACDFVVEHASCSRVHAVLLYHETLCRFALVDLRSSHGTFVQSLRIEPLTPVFLSYGDSFHFGASTRRYVVQEGLGSRPEDRDDANESVTNESRDDALPADQSAIDSLTEFNTAQNRRVPKILVSIEELRRKSRPRPNLSFCDDEEIINPEDVDPSVGRFRNLVRTAVISSSSLPVPKRAAATAGNGSKTPPVKKSNIRTSSTLCQSSMMFNVAPEPCDIVDDDIQRPPKFPAVGAGNANAPPADGNKKYVKETWPGRNSGLAKI